MFKMDGEIEKHPQEQERLLELDKYRAAFAVTEESLRFAALAANICHTAIGAISVVEKDLQWFSAIHGYNPVSVSRKDSFCGYAILQDELFIVEDTLEDERFAENPFVAQSPHVRFYAGAPLKTAKGMALGTLCIIDDKPQQLSDSQQKSLRELASQLMAFLEMKYERDRILAENARLRSLEADLEIALQKAQGASQTKSDFLANMSHELRTPLNGILGITGLLADSDLDPQQSELVHLVKECGESLLHIVNDILDLSKIEAQKMQLDTQAFEVQACLEQTLALLDQKATQKKLRLGYKVLTDIPKQVFGDSGRLKQILMNLIGNAIKFTEKGHILIKLSADKVSNQQYRIHFDVTDTGIGIAADRIEKLFQSFSQADNSITRKYGGTGLGLAISQSLAAMMGGHIEVHSEPNVGTSFSFSILVEKVDKEKEVITRSPSFAERKEPNDYNVRILVADDNPINLKLSVKLLEKFGYHHTEIATNGLEAVEKFMQFQPHLILMDVQMPEMSGLEATAKIRTLADFPRPIIIGLTASAMKEDQERCFAAGMDAYLSKPAKPEQLRETIEKWIANSSIDKTSLEI